MCFFAPSSFTRSNAYDQYVCTACGLKKVEDIRRFGRIVYRRRVTLEDSAISRAIKVKNCQHSWLLYRYGHNFKRPLFGGGAFVDGGSPSSTLQLLLIDEGFAQELSKMENPSKSWAALVSALNSSRAVDEAFASWWMDSDHVGFAAWAVSNGLSGGQRDAAKDSTINLHADIQSTAELGRRLVPGMSTNDIFAKFGEPMSVDTLGEGRTEWRYGLSGFPADDDMKGTYVMAVNITVTNGHLAGWACTYMAPPHTGGNAKPLAIGKRSEESPGERQEQPVLKLFVVSDEPIADGRQIDTPQLPKLGFISGTPNLAIKRLKQVTLGEDAVPQGDGKTSTNWQFGVSLVPEDAAGLASLTASNVGRRILITVGDVPVIAPIVQTPLKTGSFVIECGEHSLMETVRSNLTRMEQAQ